MVELRNARYYHNLAVMKLQYEDFVATSKPDLDTYGSIALVHTAGTSMHVASALLLVLVPPFKNYSAVDTYVNFSLVTVRFSTLSKSR